MFDEFDFEYELKKQYLREQNFDNRKWKSNVNDIYGGDNFDDFCKDFFELLDEEEYFEN